MDHSETGFALAAVLVIPVIEVCFVGLALFEGLTSFVASNVLLFLGGIFYSSQKKFLQPAQFYKGRASAGTRQRGQP